MILLSNSTAQTLAPGQAITFDTVLLRTGDGECCYNNAARTLTTTKLRKCGIYEVDYQANIAVAPTGTVGGIQLTMEVDGVALPETVSRVTPAAVSEQFTVGRSTIIRNVCHDIVTVTVVNTSATDIVVAPNATLMIRRIAGGAM